MHKTLTNHKLKFRTAGPGFYIGAGVEKIGGSDVSCYESWTQSDGQGMIGNGLTDERFGEETTSGWRGLEIEQPREAPGRVS